MHNSPSNTLYANFKTALLKFTNSTSKWLIQFVFFILLLNSASGNAQVKDTTLTPPQKKEMAKYHSPKKAAILSTILPGAGQIYNKKYWKVPVIYIGIAALAYSINFNEQQYNTYRVAYMCNTDTDKTNDRYINGYSTSNLFTIQKAYNRYRDLSVIGMGLLYILNIIDASVDAHLFTFDVGDNLSFNIQPTLIKTAFTNKNNTGFSLNIKF